jgi:hypothetical protein
MGCLTIRRGHQQVMHLLVIAVDDDACLMTETLDRPGLESGRGSLRR